MENVKAKAVRDAVCGVETDVLYQWRDFPTHEVRVTAISNLTLRNVEVESAKWLIRINGDAREPVKGVTLENVRCAKTGHPDVIRNAKDVKVLP